MGIDLAEHRRQVEAYIAQRPAYVTYAQALKRVLEKACHAAFPGALVQTRAKEVRSFAEKAARKYEKYHDAVNQLTDLCGGRVTVQTLQQVVAVRQFIEANFTVLEHDDKSLHLKEDRFGYRDVHYIIQLRLDRELGLLPEEREVIGSRKAEIQLRTWVQHAWADTLHDRIYKTPLRLSAETKRLGNLLAAVMEDGDRTFDRLAAQTDSMLANYSSHASRADVEQEVSVLSAVLASLPKDAERAEVTLKLARLLASAHGDFSRVIELLLPLAGGDGGGGEGARAVADGSRLTTEMARREVLSELGFAYCKVNRMQPGGADYVDRKSVV